MKSNLPPGVTDSMIPGNRPEDFAWDKLHEWIDDFSIENELEPGEIQKAIKKIVNERRQHDKA